MICEICGSSIPSKSKVCPHCGRMISRNQIELQNQILEEEKKQLKNPEFISEKFGVKREFKLRKENNYIYTVFIIIFVFIVALLVILFL